MHDELDKFCPKCEPIFHRRKANMQVGPRLDVVRDNYSGCGVDICRCPQCKRMFQVAYKVGEVTVLDDHDANLLGE